jgi:hydrogenase maturation factor
MGQNQSSNFNALRSEIERNEKLQKELEVLKLQVDQLKRNSAMKDQELLDLRNQGDDIDMVQSMRDQISALNEEKNALLDYIEEAGLE